MGRFDEHAEFEKIPLSPIENAVCFPDIKTYEALTPRTRPRPPARSFASTRSRSLVCARSSAHTHRHTQVHTHFHMRARPNDCTRI